MGKRARQRRPQPGRKQPHRPAGQDPRQQVLSEPFPLEATNHRRMDGLARLAELTVQAQGLDAKITGPARRQRLVQPGPTSRLVGGCRSGGTSVSSKTSQHNEARKSLPPPASSAAMFHVAIRTSPTLQPRKSMAQVACHADGTTSSGSLPASRDHLVANSGHRGRPSVPEHESGRSKARTPCRSQWRCCTELLYSSPGERLAG
jgi:hypothetical protein